MDLRSEVVDWLNRMAYDHPIAPTDLNDIINPSTAHIWHQLMQNTKPKAEMRKIRKALFLDRMRKQQNDGHGSGDSEVAELVLYYKKQELQTRLTERRQEFMDREQRLEKIRKQNKLKQMMVDKNEEKDKENERFAFLLKKKAEQLQSDILRVEELLNVTRNLTPVEEFDPTKRQCILKTLNECAEKLEKLPQSEHMDSFSESCNNGNDSSLGILHDISNNSVELQDDVDTTLKKLLLENNREMIWKVLQESNEAQLRESLTSQLQDTVEQPKGMSMEEKEKLYAVHIREEICARKLEKSIRSLESELHNKKNEVFQVFEDRCSSKENFEKQKDLFEHTLKNAVLDAEGEFLLKEIDEKESLLEGFNTDELDKLTRENRQIKLKISAKQRDIKEKIALLGHYHECILNSRVDTVDLVHTLTGRFSGDSKISTQPLLKKLVSKEISTFMHYPLGYNRSTVQEGKVVYYRNMCLGVMSTVDLDNISSDKLDMLLKIIENPFKFPEAQIADLVAKKKMQELLESLPKSSVVITEIDGVDVKNEERKAQTAVTKLNSVLSDIASAGGLSRVQEMVRIWNETNFGDYVSDRKLHRNQSYKHYEKLFDSILKKL